MTNSLSRDEWISRADHEVSNAAHHQFPPEVPRPLDEVVVDAWKAFRALQRLRWSNKYKQDLELACAEHYAYARAVVCAGGVIVFPFIVSASFGYMLAKELFEQLDLRQLLGALISQHDGYVTPASPDQLTAAQDGAEAGLELHFLVFTQ